MESKMTRLYCNGGNYRAANVETHDGTIHSATEAWVLGNPSWAKRLKLCVKIDDDKTPNHFGYISLLRGDAEDFMQDMGVDNPDDLVGRTIRTQTGIQLMGHKSKDGSNPHPQHTFGVVAVSPVADN